MLNDILVGEEGSVTPDANVELASERPLLMGAKLILSTLAKDVFREQASLFVSSNAWRLRCIDEQVPNL